MNYGDGWYGGVFVGAMYAIAFGSDNIKHIITEALKTIPERSEFYQCIQDVMAWHKKYPGDWKQSWLEVQKKWANDIGCPDGIFSPFNIDAKVNAAYVVIGLLYGEKDFTKTLEITTRCGQDADCNPSTAGGILGTVLGYDHIPVFWKMGLKDAESINFKYTTMSLNTVYDVGLTHAMKNIITHGGTIKGDTVEIKRQSPLVVKFEKSFEGVYPVAKIPVSRTAGVNEFNFKFEGTGFVLKGDVVGKNGKSEYVFKTELYIDGVLTEKPVLPAGFNTRRNELCWKYDLTKGKHAVRLKILNPDPEAEIKSGEAIIFSDHPVMGLTVNAQR
jgi:hypothetical protein